MDDSQVRIVNCSLPIRYYVRLEVQNVEPILETCCGMDVHKEKVTACVVSGPLDKAEEVFEVQEFSTMTCHLRELCMWLKDRDVHVVGMESTGIFWKPIFNILEGRFFIPKVQKIESWV